MYGGGAGESPCVSTSCAAPCGFGSACGPDPEKPLLRAGVRTWQPVEAFVDGVVQLGWHTNADGTITVEKKGVAERRRIDPIAGGVRIWQDSRNWLDFERVE